MEASVGQQLEAFLREHAPGASLSNIDDIILEYIVGVLAGLGEDDSSFDVDQFTDMIAAYVPEFAEVDRGIICEWVFHLVGELGTPRNDSSTSTPPPSELQVYLQDGKVLQRPYLESGGSSIMEDVERKDATTRHPSCDKENFEKCVKYDDDPEKQDLLTEMFPDVPDNQICRVLHKCKGDLEACIHLLLEHTETTTREPEQLVDKEHQDTSVKWQSLSSSGKDAQLKDFVVSRYAFVDTNDDKISHRPCMPKGDSKKMVRYRDNQVVSTKGERYSIMKKKEEDGEEVKKTYVNLKPLRKYRFH